MTDTLMKCLWVGLGGFLGANARYWLSIWLSKAWGVSFPWATLVINLSGSFLLGLFIATLTVRVSEPQATAWRLLVAVGFLGAYTTFSTFSLETLGLVESGRLLSAVANGFSSVIAGLLAAWLGVALGRAL